ncbi:MAG: PocR ligand-binding domain-containing protein [Deltaproteobacteria bacterium]|nr:PocR ligand-binding domain-containing protein [Deltaproteobacteria bacterium]
MGVGSAHLPIIEDEVVEYSQPPKTASSSILERTMSLAELLDMNAFRDVCTSFVDLYRIGIKIFDADGTKLIDIRVGNTEWCGYIFQNARGRSLCTELVTRIKQFSYPGLPDGQVVEQTCFSGLKYLITSISYGGDVLGRVVYGPFMPEVLSAPGAEVGTFGDGFEPERLWAHGHKIRRVSDEKVLQILANFRSVVDTTTFVAMKAYLTQQLHVESITASYNELAESNRKLRESLEKLRELDRLKSNFLAMVSHELRTPLTSVIGYSEMLAEGLAGELTEEQKAYATTIRDKGESLLELIGSLLDMSKIEAGAMRLNLSDVEVGPLVEGAKSYVVPQAQRKSVELIVDVQPDLPRLRADREKLRQCLINLLGNSVKFTPSGGQIRLGASVFVGARRMAVDDGRFGPPDETFVRLDVSDTGIGIPADKLEAVFERFYQVDNSITREYGGTGLGLAIVKRFVEAHEGEVWLETREGVGTTFSLLIPIERTMEATEIALS